MNCVTLLTTWVVRNGRNEMRVVGDHPTTDPVTWMDASGQPDSAIIPAPNLMMAVGIVDDAMLTALEADTNVLIISSEVVNG